MTAPSLSIPAGTLAAAWQQARGLVLPRVMIGGGAALAVIVVSQVLNGSRVTLDPAVPLVVVTLIAGYAGGLRSAAIAAVLVILYSAWFYAQPHTASAAGNGLRTLVFAASAALTAYLAGSQRERLDRFAGGAGSTRATVDRVRQFSAALAEVRPDLLAAAVVSRAAALAEADMAALTVVDMRTGRHVVRAVHGTSPGAVGVEVLPGVGLAGQAILDHQTVVVGEPVDEVSPFESARLRIIRLVNGEAANAAPATNVTPRPAPAIALPAINSGSVVATLTLGRVNPNRPFTDDERAVLDLVAPQLGLAVANALIRGQLREASLIDPLTGLYNRAYLDAVLDQMIALRRRLPVTQRQELSLIMFDIDGFRQLNEIHGQAVGDQVLRAMAALLRQRFRASDTIARVGGDAFVVVLDGAGQKAAVEAAGQVRAHLREMALADERGTPLTISVSAGCAMFRDDAARSETIIRGVEAALDTARWSGPGSVVAI